MILNIGNGLCDLGRSTTGRELKVIRTEALEEAKNIIQGARNEKYGPATENLGHIAYMFEEYLGTPVTKVDVCNLMILVKIARSIHDKTHKDNYIDIIGYAALGAEMIDDES